MDGVERVEGVEGVERVKGVAVVTGTSNSTIEMKTTRILQQILNIS